MSGQRCSCCDLPVERCPELGIGERMRNSEEDLAAALARAEQAERMLGAAARGAVLVDPVRLTALERAESAVVDLERDVLRAETRAAKAERRLEEVRAVLVDALEHRGSSLHDVGAWQTFARSLADTIAIAEVGIKATGQAEPAAPALDPADVLELVAAVAHYLAVTESELGTLETGDMIVDDALETVEVALAHLRRPGAVAYEAAVEAAQGGTR